LGFRTGPNGRLLSDGPLVVLNSCFTGRSREFGGQREDLAWAILQEGAEAVIACGLPVFNRMGEFFGKLLYSFTSARSPGMAWHFAEVRALVEEYFRQMPSLLWPAWTLLHYHGNPFVRLPHADHVQPAVRSAAMRDVSSLAEVLKLPGTQEAETLLGNIRRRLGRY
jgi:hypothetical protein